MTYSAYPEYKDSGVEWLGEVPAHWEVQPLKRAITSVKSGTSVNALDIPAAQGELGVLKTSCVYKGWFDWRENKTVNKEDLERVSCPLIRNTLIVSRMNTPDLVGSAGLVVEAPPGIFLPDRLWQVFLKDSCISKYYYYFTRTPSYRDQVKIACAGTSSSMQNLGQDEFGAIWHLAPPKQEQKTIAAFLDHETARIDALVEEQQRLIALLKEKRQAVISHAVTKGLDPDVPMKDSGVEWLGEVPEHWEVGSLKYALEVVADVDHYMPTSVDSGVPYVMTGDLSRLVSEIDLDSCKKVTREDYQKLSRKIKTSKGDVIMARYATIGSVSYVDIDEEFIVSYSCVTIRPRAELTTGIYLFYYFQSDAFIQGISNMINANTQENVGVGDLKEVKVTLPNIQVQKAIADELEVRLTNLDRITKSSKTTIHLLKERRYALISAAVTGKIDVRGWQPPEVSAAQEASQQEAV